MVSIYTLSDPITGLVRYVGKTAVRPESRYAQHIYQWKRCKGKISHLNNWIKSLCEKSLKPVLNVIDTVEESEWVSAEQGYIRLYKSFGCQLVNLTIGGEGSSDYKATPESIQKRLESLETSEAWKEKHIRHSEIMKKLHAEKVVFLGTAHLPKEVRKELGERHSVKLKQLHAENPEYRQALINSRVVAVDLIDDNGNVVMSFKSAAEAGRFLNINNTHITRVCKGKSASTHGLKFRYKK